MKYLIGISVFIVLQILFIPLAIVGITIAFYKQVYGSKKLGVSATAIEILSGRWTMDVFGLRKDLTSIKLCKVLPNISVTALWLVLFPLYAMRKITGKNTFYPIVPKQGYENLKDMVMSRTVYFDNILERNLADSEQFVVMGAGFDTRCYGGLVPEHLALFELDQKKTQELKIQMLQKANVDLSNINFVEVNFQTNNWLDELILAGYDTTKKTTFLWEGVTLYVSELDIRNTLQVIKAHASKESILVADFYSKDFVTGEHFPMMKKTLKTLKETNEEFGFGIPFQKNDKTTFQSFISNQNIKLGESYYMGDKLEKGTWMVEAELIFE